MPSTPLPAELVEFLRQPNPAVVASLRPDGSPHAVPTWYDREDDGLVLMNMDASRRRLAFMRRDPRVALTVLDRGGEDRHVSLFGRIVRIETDADLRDIDRLALRYAGAPFGRRDARRVSTWMEVESWHGWEGAGPWPRPSSA